jgi:hypothetical protein
MFIARHGRQPISEVRALSRLERIVVSDVLVELIDEEFGQRPDVIPTES